MDNLKPITFMDADSGDNAVAVVHAEEGRARIRFFIEGRRKRSWYRLGPERMQNRFRALREAQSSTLRGTRTIEFLDTDSGDEAVVIVRAVEGLICVALSLKKDGDIELVFPPTEGRAFAETLAAALSMSDATRPMPPPT